jgi:protein gp37
MTGSVGGRPAWKGRDRVAENSKIEWTDHTFNPWTGCTNVSPGCDHCYAEAWSKRSGHVRWGNYPRKRTTAAYWRAPPIWDERHAEFFAVQNRRQRVFCASLADVFDNQVPPEWRADLFTLIRRCSSLDWLLLTKRPQNIAKMLPADWGGGYGNVWLGMTAEDQPRYDQRWSHLAAVPAVVRFVSYEPAIGPLRLHGGSVLPDWLICGGESGAGARPMSERWVHAVLDDCLREGVAPFFKQWGTYTNNPLKLDQSLSTAAVAVRDPHGKGGGLVRGRLLREYPVPRPGDEALVNAA